MIGKAERGASDGLSSFGILEGSSFGMFTQIGMSVEIAEHGEKYIK